MYSFWLIGGKVDTYIRMEVIKAEANQRLSRKPLSATMAKVIFRISFLR